MSGPDTSGFAALGDALAGRGAMSQVQGAMMGARFADMGAMAQNALSQVPLHNAQTALALANARAAQTKSNALSQAAATSNADFLDPQKAPLAALITAGLGADYNSAMEGHGRAVLGDKAYLNKPDATAASEAVTGKLAGPQTVGPSYTVPAGVAPPQVHQTAAGAAQTAATQARADLDTKMAASFVNGVKPPSGYEADPHNPGHIIPIPGGPADVNATWTPQALDNAAERYRQTGILPPVGFGSAGALVRGKIISRAADLSAQMGDNASAAAYRQLANKANETALAAVTKQQQMVGSYEQTALANMGLAESALGKVDLSGSPLLNRAIIAWKQHVAGDPDTAAYVNALTTAQNEYAKVLSGATGSTGITDAARREANDLFSKISSPAQIHQVFQIARQEMANRMNSFQSQQAELRGMIVGTPGGGVQTSAGAPAPTAGAPAAAPATSQFTEGQTAINRATGQRLIFRGGQWQPLQ